MKQQMEVNRQKIKSIERYSGSDVIAISLPLKPISAGRIHTARQKGKVVGYNTKSYQKFTSESERLLYEIYKKEGVEYIQQTTSQYNAFIVDIVFQYKLMNSRFHDAPKINKADIDNLSKAVYDAICEKVLHIKDENIYGTTAYKSYGDTDNIYITIYCSNVDRPQNFKNEHKKSLISKKLTMNDIEEYEKLIAEMEAEL